MMPSIIGQALGGCNLNVRMKGISLHVAPRALKARRLPCPSVISVVQKTARAALIARARRAIEASMKTVKRTRMGLAIAWIRLWRTRKAT